LTSINGPAKSYMFVSASIITQNANSYDYKQFKIEEARIPESIYVKKAPAKKGVAGGDSEFDIIVRDQYGAELDYNADSNYYVQVIVDNATGVNTTVNARN